MPLRDRRRRLQRVEALARSLSSEAPDPELAADPVELARQAGIEPDPWQAHVLRSTAPRLLLNCSRQSGKSTVAGIVACHQALFGPPAPIILLAPSERQSQELFRKTVDAYRATGRIVAAESETKLTLELATG